MIGSGFAVAAVGEILRGALPIIAIVVGGLVRVGFLAGYLVFG